MKITVKRRHVLEALRYNNLVAGSWFLAEEETFNGENVYKANCSACLVGSTIRRAQADKPRTSRWYDKIAQWIGDVTTSGDVFGVITQSNSSPSTPKDAVSENRYLTALSRMFESTMRNKAALKYNVSTDELSREQVQSVKLSKKERQELRQWVLDNIPVEFTVDDVRRNG